MPVLDGLDAYTRIVELWKPDFHVHLHNVAAIFRVGSHSHGTHVAPTEPTGIDDTDFMMIVVPPPERVLGLHRFENFAIQQDGLDVVVYEWGKYVRMLLASNPNVLGTLWLELEDMWLPPPYRFMDVIGNRSSVFMSKRAHKAFVGYARAQMHKMTHHIRDGYLGAKRKVLIERFGYDCKNASHMIRLLRMCVEFLNTGEMLVRRPDAAELIEIKQGRWSLERVSAEADSLFLLADAALETSGMGVSPDEGRAEQIVLNGYWRAWGNDVAAVRYGTKP